MENNNSPTPHAQDTRDGLLQKVRALLAKTTGNGCTEAETLAALAKARAMMDAYEISDAELELTKEEKAIIRDNASHDPHLIKRGLLHGVAEFTSTEYWYTTGLKTRTFCGLPADVEFAEWLVETLAQFVQAELVEFLAQNVFFDGRERRSAMRSFVIGCTQRITDRLIELSAPPPNQTSNTRALVVTKQGAIDACKKAAGIKLCCGAGRTPAGDASAYDAGHAAGNRASFGRPVTGGAAVLRLGGRHG